MFSTHPSNECVGTDYKTSQECEQGWGVISLSPDRRAKLNIHDLNHDIAAIFSFVLYILSLPNTNTFSPPFFIIS